MFMSLKYVLSAMRRRKLRTAIIAAALIVGVALVGALLALVDTQRQFSIQAVSQQTGGYDLSISMSDTAASPFFDITEVTTVAKQAYTDIASTYARVQASAEARKSGVLDGQSVTFVAIDTEADDLVSLAQTNGSSSSGVSVAGIRIGSGGRGSVSLTGGGGQQGGGGPQGGPPPGEGGPPGAPTNSNTSASTTQSARVSSREGGSYPPEAGQVFLDTTTAGALGVNVGDEIRLSYALPTAREVGTAAITGTSAPRVEAAFTVAGIGVLNGLSSDVSNPVILRLADAQTWLGQDAKANQLLLNWQTKTGSASDARLIVTQAREVGTQVRDTLQAKLGSAYTVSLPKYTRLESTSQAYTFTQTFITLYGLLSMGIVGLMVNALMMTTVAEQKYDLAVLRVLGSPRHRMYEIVVLEVIMLGVVGVVFGLLLGRLINDYLIVPIVLANLNLPAGVRADWTLQTVLVPTAITAGVLALATINPARAAASTKVMVVLNPAAADQPTLDDLSKLRERRPDRGLFITGVVLLAFSAIILIVLPTVMTPGNFSGEVMLNFGSLLLMVIGMSLLFYFITTPLERILVFLYRLVSRRASYLAGRYAMRGKGRNAIISLLVVMSGVLPCLLATQLALQDANLDTDTRFRNGAPLVVQMRSSGGNFPVFRRAVRLDSNLSDADIAAVRSNAGVADVVGVADNLPNMTVSDLIALRSARVNLVGLQGDLTRVLYTDLFRWAEGDGSALARVIADPNAAIISEGLSQSLDLHLGDTLRIKGVGNDHERLMTIVGIASRVPGFQNYFSRSRSEANGSGIFINLETYRELNNDPSKGEADPTANLLTKLMATLQPGVNESALLNTMRSTLGNQNSLSISATSEQVAQARAQLAQSRVFTVLLTGLSMVTAIFGVLAVMYTAVMGRRVEIGMLKAIGASKGSLRGTFIGEALVTTLSAGLAGIIAGTVLGYIFEVSQRLQNDRPILPAFDFTTAALIVALVCVAAVFSAALAVQPVLRQKAITILRER